MLENREKKELLEILLAALKTSIFKFGLCHLINQLYFSEIISQMERRRLNDHITFNTRQNCGSGYIWPPGAVEVREKWLNEQIDRL